MRLREPLPFDSYAIAFVALFLVEWLFNGKHWPNWCVSLMLGAQWAVVIGMLRAQWWEWKQKKAERDKEAKQ